MGRISNREFVGTRVRLQRFDDARIFHGWIESFSETAIDASTTTGVPVAIGDQFFVEAFGHGVTGTFTVEVESIRPFDMMYGGRVHTICDGNVRLIDAARATVRFEITSTVRFSHQLENVRVRVEDLPATLKSNDDQFAVRVLDIGPSGLAAIFDRVVEPRTPLELVMFTPFGDISGNCESKYCRSLSPHADSYRVGLKFTDIDRINEQRWQRFMREFV